MSKNFEPEEKIAVSGYFRGICCAFARKPGEWPERPDAGETVISSWQS